MAQVRTHIYWMMIKEYERWSKNKPNDIRVIDDTITRKHIYFI